MPYVNGTWVNWTSGIVHNITNSTNPIGALTTSVGSQLPWFWPMIPFMLYIILIIQFNSSPGRFKLAAIAALVMVISIFMGASGMILNAIINIVIFIFAYFISFLFKR
jgi:hypothetical protein